MQQPWTRRREKLRTRPRRPRTHRLAKRRRRRRRRARPRGAGAGGAGGRRPRPGADDQPSGRRTFPSVLNARSPGMKPPRDSGYSRVAPTRGGPRHRFLETINRQDSITQAWTPEELAYAARVSDCVESVRRVHRRCASLSHFSAMTRPSWLSGGEEPASPRHRAGVASMAWRTTRRFRTNAP